MRKQDEGLDMLSASVARLGEHAMSISDELGQQNQVSSVTVKVLCTSAEYKTDFLFNARPSRVRCLMQWRQT